MPKVAKEDNFEYVLLGLLNHTSLSGYDIKKKMDFEVNNFYPKVGLNKIYPTLKKLEKKKLVKMNEHKTSNRPSKKIYSITTSGKNKLTEWLQSPLKIRDEKYGLTIFKEFLIRLYFSSLIPKEETIDSIDELKDWLKNTLEIFDLYEHNLRNVIDEESDHKYYLLTVLFGKTIYEATLKWTDIARKILK